jgi:hypothetical protein
VLTYIHFRVKNNIERNIEEITYVNHTFWQDVEARNLEILERFHKHEFLAIIDRKK